MARRSIFKTLKYLLKENSILWVNEIHPFKFYQLLSLWSTKYTKLNYLTGNDKVPHFKNYLRREESLKLNMLIKSQYRKKKCKAN